jgi:predicted nicotinamide N-methyase
MAERDQGKGRWGILRQALLAPAPGGHAANSASIHRHEGFHLLQRKEGPWVPTIELEEDPSTNPCGWISEALLALGDLGCEVMMVPLREPAADVDALCQQLVGGSDGALHVRTAPASSVLLVSSRGLSLRDGVVQPWRLVSYEHMGYRWQTRERSGALQRRIRVADVLCHRMHGVDNTGNVRIWAAEGVLLHVLAQPDTLPRLKGKRLLEVGGGMTGLAGLALSTMADLATVVLTDGNPDALLSQKACVRLNLMKVGTTSVSSKLLLWDRLDRQGHLQDILDDGGKFDIVIGADCLFFKDFHEDLHEILCASLLPGGCVWLLQPARGGTMQLFLELVRRHGRFQAEIVERYDEIVWQLHETYLGSEDGRYDPDIHYPILVRLTFKAS